MLHVSDGNGLDIYVPRKNGTHSFKSWARENQLKFEVDAKIKIPVDSVPYLIVQDPLRRFVKGILEAASWQNVRNPTWAVYPEADDKTYSVLADMEQSEFKTELLVHFTETVWRHLGTRDPHLETYGGFVGPLDPIPLENLNALQRRIENRKLTRVPWQAKSAEIWPSKYRLQNQMYKLFSDSSIAVKCNWFQAVFDEYERISYYKKPW